MKKTTFVFAVTSALSVSPVFADDAELKTQIEQLKHQLATQAAQLQQLESQTNALADQQQKSATAPSATNSSEAAGAGSNTTFGGYGEIGYNDYRQDSSRNQADLKRFVLFFGHRNEVRQLVQTHDAVSIR